MVKNSVNKCMSTLLKGYKDIPDSWAECLSEDKHSSDCNHKDKEKDKTKDKDNDEEEEQEAYHTIESVSSEFTCCLACFFKWKFFIGNQNYCDFRSNKYNDKENNISKTPLPKDDKKFFKCQKEGKELFNYHTDKFMKKNIKKRC